VVRKQKTDARDAAHLLELMCSDRFPKIWRPSGEERDLRQLVWHRQKLVWMRGAVKNQMHALAMGEGVCRKKKLFTAKGRKELEGLALGPWASYRRQELLRMFDELQTSVARLDQAVEQAAKSQALAVRLMTHPGVGPVTSLAFVLIIGPGTFPTQQAGGELSGTESAGAQFGREAAAGIDQQARQSDDAIVAGRSRSHRGAFGSATAPRVSTFEVPSWGLGGKGCRGPQAGREDVLDAAPRGGLRAASSHARQPVGHPGGEQSIAGLIGRLASLRESGSLNNESWSE
jgi:transposase